MNRLYDSGGNAFLSGGINWETNDVRLALVADAYVFSPVHNTGSDLGSNIVGVPISIPDKRAEDDGVADGDAVLFTALTDGRSVAYVVLMLWNTSVADSSLIAFYDDIAGMPFTPTGGNYSVLPDTDLEGFFQIGGDSC